MVPAMASTFNQTPISIIIPVCSLVPEAIQERIEVLNAAIEKFYRNTEVIVVEQNITGKFHFLPHLKGCKKIELKYPVFNKPWCLNVGVKHSSYEYVVLADADMYSHEAYWNKLLMWMKENEYPWAFSWNRLIYTKREQRDGILRGASFPGVHHETPRPGLSEGGLVCFFKPFFYNIGQCNELFQELGGPDNEVILRCRAASSSYSMFPALVYHMLHKQRRKSLRPTRKRNINLLSKTRKKPMKMIKWLCEQNQGNEYSPLVARKEVFG